MKELSKAELVPLFKDNRDKAFVLVIGRESCPQCSAISSMIDGMNGNEKLANVDVFHYTMTDEDFDNEGSEIHQIEKLGNFQIMSMPTVVYGTGVADKKDNVQKSGFVMASTLETTIALLLENRKTQLEE